MRANGIRPRTLVPLLSAILVGASGLADVRADQLLTGKKLLIKNPPAGPTTNKLVHLGKDASITREVGLSELSLAGRGPCDLSPLDGMDDAARE